MGPPDFRRIIQRRDEATNTGFALANANTGSAVTVILQLISESGNASPSATGADAQTITLPAGNQAAQFVTSIWPQLATGFRGSLLVFIRAGQPDSLALIAINVKNGLLSTAPTVSGAQNSCWGCWDY
jgi:hypothetical protein